MKTLSDVHRFGGISAEDDDLKKYFVATPIFEQVRNGERQVVIGRKGAGKTALHLALLTAANGVDSFAIGLNFQNYPWAMQSAYQSDTTNADERFINSWKFLILIEIFKFITTDSNRESRYAGKSAADAIKAVSKFINNNWGSPSFDFKKSFPSGGFKIDGITIGPQILGNGLGGVNAARGGVRLGETIARLNEWLFTCLQPLGKSAPTVFILFDELDFGFDPHSAEYTERVIGLLLAVRTIAKEFKSQGYPFKPIAFLRSDIFDSLHFGDKNKLTEANATFLHWNDDLELHDSSLKELIDHRIQEELELPSTDLTPWNKAFDMQLMRGTQHKFHHITTRTYLRPRDVIKFCNSTLDAAKTRFRRKKPASQIITNEDIRNARSSYSQYLIRELDDEIAPSQRDWKNYLEILRKIRTTTFSADDFIQAHNELQTSLSLKLGAREALALFYKYSILGFERLRGGSAGYYYHFRYFDETIIFDNQSSRYMVHRGLKEGLGLVEDQERSPMDDFSQFEEPE